MNMVQARNLPFFVGAVLCVLLGAGCTIKLNGASSPPSPAAKPITGVIQDASLAYNWNLGAEAWSAQLMLSADYNGHPNVLIADNGYNNCVFHDFVVNGARVTISAAAVASQSLGSLSPSDVTVNGKRLADFAGC